MMGRCAGQLVGAVVLILLAAAPVWAGEDCSGCTLLGELSVELSEIEPAEPQVGDEVTFTFSVFSRLPSFFDCSGTNRCTFSGGPPILMGDSSPMLEVGGIVVEREAAEAGVATVQLDLQAETEEQCRFENEEGECVTFFQPAFITASTGPIEVEVQAPPTATPTATPIHKGSDDDGCAITPSEGPSVGAGVLLVPVLLLVTYRRRL